MGAEENQARREQPGARWPKLHKDLDTINEQTGAGFHPASGWE